jgi:hypothetical protein
MTNDPAPEAAPPVSAALPPAAAGPATTPAAPLERVGVALASSRMPAPLLAAAALSLAAAGVVMAGLAGMARWHRLRG